MSRHPPLAERDKRILGVLVHAYIDQGEPVSSLWLANRGFGVSSATLRNIMARLEELGYVRQPHTSAGRVPTDLGYRLYVDQLLAERKSLRPAPQVEARLRRAGTVDDLLSHVSQEVSRASHQIGFAIAPDMTTFERLDFVPLAGGKLLVLVVAAGGHVTQKVIEPTEEYEPSELQQAANYLNQQFRGKTLVEVRQAVVERLREERTLYDELMARALRLASSTFEGIDPIPTVFIQGTSLLLDDVRTEDPEVTLTTLRTLFRMIEEKTRLIQLLDDYLGTTGLTVVIGSEHPRYGSSVLQPGRVDLFGWTRDRRGRSDRSAHACATLARSTRFDSLSKAISRMVSGERYIASRNLSHFVPSTFMVEEEDFRLKPRSYMRNHRGR
jgi:heat-inducible transcriptional repressor